MAFLEGCGEVRHNVDAGNKLKQIQKLKQMHITQWELSRQHQ